MIDLGNSDDPIADLNAYWRTALKNASEHVEEDVAGMAMMLTAVQYLKSGMGVEGAADFLEKLSRILRDGTMITVTVGDVRLNLKDDGSQTH